MITKTLTATVAVGALFGCSISRAGELPRVFDALGADAALSTDAADPPEDTGTRDTADHDTAPLPVDAGQDAMAADAVSDAGPRGLCDHPIDVTDGGTWTGDTCGGDGAWDCWGSEPAPERWYVFAGMMARFEASPGYRLIISAETM